jgi:hypothetical protein
MKPGRRLAGAGLAQTDPDKYVYDYILPALEKHGITKQEDQIQQVRRMFPAGRSADLVTKLIQQRESFANHAKLYGEAQGLNATDNNQKDPFVALNSLGTSLSNFAGVLTSPAMETAASVMSGMASSVSGWANSLSKFSEANPTASKYMGGGALAAGAGAGIWGTYQLFSGLMSGFGLGASATALDGSAAALSAAAAELSGAAGVGAATKGAAAAAGGLLGGGSIWKAGAMALPLIGAGVGAYYLAEGANEAQGITRDSTRARMRKQQAKYNWWGKYIGDGGDLSSAPEVSPTTTYGTGVSGDKSVSVSGTVTGEGKFDVTVNAGSSLLDVVRRAEAAIRLSGSVSNGPGSLGHSSPDANAPTPSSGPAVPASY